MQQSSTNFMKNKTYGFPSLNLSLFSTKLHNIKLLQDVLSI